MTEVAKQDAQGQESTSARFAVFERSKELARGRMLDELERQSAKEAELEGLLQSRDQELAKLAEAAGPDEDHEAVASRREKAEKDPRNIPAEDALDTITRLENMLKLEERRNKMIRRENATQNKILKDKTKELEKLKKSADELVWTTGFHEKTALTPADETRARVAEMEALEKTVIDEEKTARVIVRKKQQLVEALIDEVESKKRKEEELFALYNDIRVKNRDLAQKKVEIDELKREDRKTDGALVVAENKRDHVALTSLEGDKEFLSREIQKQKELRRTQDDILRLQSHRAQQLYTRLDIIQGALRDLKLETKMERAISKAAIVADSQGEPDDKERIMPSNEMIPIETYQLLVHDLEVVKNSVSRKDIITLEKETTAQALEEKVEMATAKNIDEDRQREVARQTRGQKMEEMQVDLSTKLTEYRKQIDALLSGNLKLRNLIERGK